LEGADLAPVYKAWNLLDENFVPATTGSTSSPQATAAVTTQDKIWGMISGLAASYGDDYTQFFPPKEKQIFETSLAGNFEGVGMEIAVKAGVLTVVAPLKGNAAERAGVKSGDKILTIDDESTEGLSVEEAVGKIRGPGGTTVKLSLLRDSELPFDVSIVRETINLPIIDTTLRPDGVFVLRLYSFNAMSPQEFRNAVREFAASGSDKLIIDLRGNPGGYLEAAADIASWFLPVGKPVVTSDYGGKQPEEVFRSRGYDVFTDNLKLVILIDGGSASASEILAGAMKDYGKATLIGETSFGKGSVQQTFDVTPDTALKITVARWLTPNRVSISHQGIAPDIKVEMTDEDLKAGRDPQLDRAVEYLLTGK
jgi:carboxyl-terminal processing protease